MRRKHGTFSTVLILWMSTYCGNYRISPKILWIMGKYAQRLFELWETAKECNEIK